MNFHHLRKNFIYFLSDCAHTREDATFNAIEIGGYWFYKHKNDSYSI